MKNLRESKREGNWEEEEKVKRGKSKAKLYICYNETNKQKIKNKASKPNKKESKKKEKWNGAVYEVKWDIK